MNMMVNVPMHKDVCKGKGKDGQEAEDKSVVLRRPSVGLESHRRGLSRRHSCARR